MRRQIQFGALAVLGAASIFVWYGVITTAPNDTLRVAFLDVGQGDAVFIETPAGTQVLIDGGADVRVARMLDAQLSPFDRSIDVVLATHPDADHIGGLTTILERYDVGMIMHTGLERDTAAYTAFASALRAEGATVVTAQRGMRVELGADTVLSILFPDRDMTGVDINAASIVAKLTHGETHFLFTGDAPNAIERYLAQLDTHRLDVDVLKVGHHGSDTSTSLPLLGYASPAHAVISAGADNPYGHPHESVLETLARFDIETLGTYEHGTIVFESDGREVTRVRK